jgi:formamidopyrimidine-DNA glycosylase
MPELPEVETTLRGLKSHLEGKKVQDVMIRCNKLRWPVSSSLETILTGQQLHALSIFVKKQLLRRLVKN